jgi:hypothetical protein
VDSNLSFNVSPEEFEFLKKLASGDEAISNLLKTSQFASARRVTIGLNRAVAEELRERLTIQLATFGFDENYSPNKLGQMCEDLIDRFFVP